MNTEYYIVKRTDDNLAVDYLSAITGNYTSFYSDYLNAIEISTQAIASAFKDYCVAKDSVNTYGVVRVQVTLTDVVLNEV